MLTFVRSVLFNVHFYFLTLCLVILFLPLLLFPNIGTKFAAKVWYLILISGLKTWLNVNIKILGKFDKKKNVIYAVKHQSALETVVCADLFNMPAIVLKKELLFIPFIGLYFLVSGAIAISRSNSLKSLKKISYSARKSILKKGSILIYPQGTRVPVNSNTNKYPYLPGVYFIYSKCNIPVIPVTHNAGLLWPKNSFLKFPNRLKSKNITFKILKEIPTGLNKTDFMKILENRIEKNSKTLIKEEAYE